MNWAVADFETTVFDGQTFTEVWAAGFMQEKGNPEIYNSMDAFIKRLNFVNNNLLIYFHNIKFDGSFIIPYLINNGYTEAYDFKLKKYKKKKDMKKMQYTCHINRKGVWYNIVVKLKSGVTVSFIDSLKIIPFSLEAAGKAFQTEHRKLTMDYYGERKSGGHISENERKYLENDLYVLYECIEKSFENGIIKRTIGSTCLHYFKKLYGFMEYKEDFPNVYEIKIPNDFKTVGKYILRSYNGAFILIKEGCENKVFENGITIDATSLYASVMHSMSGYSYPYGNPHYEIGKATEKENKYFFQRFKCRFKLKEGYLPFIRIRGNLEFSPRKIQKTNVYEIRGFRIDNKVEFVLCQEELKLFFEHYDVYDIEYLDYVWFWARKGIFDEYIDIWIERKETAENKVKRTIAKLFLTNLYGKFAAVPDSSYHMPYLDEDGIMHMEPVLEEEAIPGYIPIGSSIVAHARITDVKAAQANYEHFIYTDTDSLHLTCGIEDVKGVVIDTHKLCTFKHECSWEYAIFNNVKRYIEKIIEEDGEACEPHYAITCAGMAKEGKKILSASLEYGEGNKSVYECIKDNGCNVKTIEEYKFIKSGKNMKDFCKGLEIPKGKIKARRIKGGTVLYEGEFTIL